MDTENQAQEPSLGQIADQAAEPVEHDEIAHGAADTDSTEHPSVSDAEEIDYDGEKYTVPKKLKEAFLRQQDYTRKTQEAAAIRKEAETARETYNRLASMRQEAVEAHGYMSALNGQISELEKTDFQALFRENPLQAQQAWIHLQQLERARDNVARGIEQYEHASQEQKAREHQQKMQKGMERLKREIKDLTPEYAAKLQDFAVRGLGFDPDEVAQISDPAVIIAINKAYLGEQLVKKAATPTQQATAPTAQPARRVTANAPAKKDEDSMTAEEWARNRNLQLRKQQSAPKPFNRR